MLTIETILWVVEPFLVVFRPLLSHYVSFLRNIKLHITQNPTRDGRTTLQRTNVIQRDTIDNRWADLLPKEKQALQALGFNNDGVRQILSPTPRSPQRTLPQTWDRLTPEQRTPIFQKTQTQLKQTVMLKGLGEKGGDVSGLTDWQHFTDYHDFLVSAGINQGNIGTKLAEAQDLVQRYKAWGKIDEEAKAELEEKFGIATPQDFAKVPRSRAEEVQKILDNAKTKKEETAKTEGEEKKIKTARQEREDLAKHPGSGEIMKEGWRGVGTSIKRGFRSLFGGFMSSNTAKRRIYGRS